MKNTAKFLGIIVFGFLTISCLTTPQAIIDEATGEAMLASVTNSTGAVNHIPPPDNKPFEALGLVFATSVTVIDHNGLVISSQEGVVTLLLREAQKLGGHDILNLRINENITQTGTIEKVPSNTTGSGGRPVVEEKMIVKKTITYTGSALAVRYRN